MNTIRIKPRGITAVTAVLVLILAGAFAQDDKKSRTTPTEKAPAGTAAPKKSNEAGKKKLPPGKAEPRAAEAKIEIRIDGVAQKVAEKPEDSKRHAPRKVPTSPQPQSQELKLRTWLGIAMRDLPQALREYLDLAEGFGVQVEHVAAESPAAKAGLKVHDILTKLDDQQLISPEHVALLVRSKKNNAEVEITFIRKGKEQSVEVVLGEKELPPFSNEVPSGFGFEFQKPEGQGGRFELRGNLPISPKQKEELHRYLRGYQDNLKQWLEKNPGTFRSQRENPGANPKKAVPPKDAPAEPRSPLRPIPPLPGNSSSGKPPALSVSPGYPIQLFGGAGIVKIDNPKGEVTITNNKGSHKITIKNKDGETVYDGPYENEKDLPREARDQLKEMKLDDLKLLTPPKNDARPESKTTPKKNGKGKIL